MSNKPTPDQLDRVATSLIEAYHRSGEFAMIVRTYNNGDIRCISPQIGAEITSEFLRKAADVLFDGPAEMRDAKTGDKIG